MEENVSRFVTAIIAVFIMFVFPVYTAYEKKDDISYALAVRYTQDFVDNIRKKGYITQELYHDYQANLFKTGNTYDVQLEHEYVRYDGNYVDKTAGSATTNTEVFTNNHIVNILNNGQVYTMNKDDNFNVKIKNTNVTLATVIYNIVTVNTSSNNVRIFVDYGGRILAEKWYEQGLMYSEYGGIVSDDEDRFYIQVVVDRDAIVDNDVPEIIDPSNFLSNNVKIGDYVEYYSNGSTAYSLSLLNSTLYMRRWDNIYWRVMHIDYANSKVTLVSDTQASNTVNLSPKQNKDIEYDYITGLNEACKQMYSNSNFGIARSITKDDLNKIIDQNLKYINTNYLLPSVKRYDDNNIILEYNGIRGNTSDENTRPNNSLNMYLRPVVELNSKVIIDYTIGGCDDSTKPCGTKTNPWKLLINKQLTLGDVAEIGDYVKYEPDSVTTSVVIPKEVSGHTLNQTFTQQTTTWQVLKKSGNKVLLISKDITKYRYGGGGGLTLKYPQDFNNGVDILNNICKALYSKNGIATARSLTLNDIKDLFNYDVEYVKHTLTPNDKYPARLRTSSFIGNSPAKIESWLRTPLEHYITTDTQITLPEGHYKEIMAINYTGITVNYNSDKHKSLLVSKVYDYSDYWLAELSITSNNDSLNYRPFYMWDVSSTITLYPGYSYHRGGVRAVVELDENILIDNSYSGVDGSSSSKAWVLKY